MKQDIEYAVPLFKAGAEWRINSVWHDAREKPDKGKFLRNVAADIWVEYTEPEQRGRLFNLINKKK